MVFLKGVDTTMHTMGKMGDGRFSSWEDDFEMIGVIPLYGLNNAGLYNNTAVLVKNKNNKFATVM